MLWVILLALTSWLCSALYMSGLEKATRANDNEVAEMIKVAIKKPKEFPVDVGSIIDVPGECYVLGVFFDKDVKFCTFCHRVDKRLVAYPGVAEVSDDNKVVFHSKNLTKEVIDKSYRMYIDYKDKNINKFIGEHEDEL